MKTLIALILLVVLIIAGYYGYHYAKSKAGGIIPAFMPTKEKLADKIREQQLTGETPELPIKLPEGFEIGVFQDELSGVRDLEFTTDGTLIASLPSQGKVVALPDKNKDGLADDVVTLALGLNKPHGLAFHHGKLFIAEETKVSRYSYNGNVIIIGFEKKLFDLPSGGRHTTRSLVFDKKDNLYVSLGSTCDTCVEKNPFISTVLISDEDGKEPRVYSKGLRNAVFLTLHPESGRVYVTEMGRDNLGDNLPPDEINVLADQADFGWPYCYGNKIKDTIFSNSSGTRCDVTHSPFYEIPAHSAPLGLTFITSPQMPEEWQNDLLVAYHGSWNRSTPTGYKIVRITTKGEPKEEDFMTGFIEDGKALGRPVDVIFDKAGSLFISDDKGDAVYKMVKK